MKKLFFVGAAVATPAMAFDPRTHLWIAQEVLNEVTSTGKVTIEGKSYSVSARIVEALQKFPAAYRAGAIGPDAYPDLVVGQTTTHPGIEGGWQTDDFLAHIKAGAEGAGLEELAFAFGFYSHAAGDIFAHTYVNTYSGDFFELTDSETDVELRHFTLEKYLGQKTPDLRDANANPVGDYHTSFKAPAQFAARMLILNNEVAAQYLKSVKTTMHLVAMNGTYQGVKSARIQLESLSSKLNGLLAAAGISVKGAETAAASTAERYVIDYKNSLVKKEEFDKLMKLVAEATKAVKNLEMAVTKANEPISGLVAKANAAAGKLANAKVAEANLASSLAAANEAVSKLEKVKQTLEAKLPGLNHDVARITMDIAALDDKTNGLHGQIPGLKDIIKGVPFCKKVKPCKDAKKRIEEIEGEITGYAAQRVPMVAQLEAAKRRLVETQQAIATKSTEITSGKTVVASVKGKRITAAGLVKKINIEKSDMDAALTKARKSASIYAADLEKARAKGVDLEKAGKVAKKALDQANLEVKKAQVKKDEAVAKLEKAVTDLKNLEEIKVGSFLDVMRAWERDLEKGADEYIVAAENVIRNIMQEKSLGEAFDPLFRWKDCWAPVYAGTPTVVANGQCQATNGVKDAIAHGEAMLEKAKAVAGEVVPLLAEINRIKLELIERAKIEIGKALVPEGAKHYYGVLINKVTRDTLNQVFQHDSSGKQLIKFESVADQIDSDLNLLNGKIDINKFAPAANARNLVKLTLMGASELNELSAAFGASGQTSFGPGLYQESKFVNVLHRAVRSIDGNHQWRGEGLPPLRRYGVDLGAKRDFGYLNTPTKPDDGFRFWVEEEHREKVFGKVFQFPLSPSLKELVKEQYVSEF